MVLDDNHPSIGKQPHTEAHVRIVEGDQRSGKTCYAVGYIKDTYDKDCVNIFCRDVLKIDCIVKSYDRKTRVARIKYNGENKLIQIPISYELISPLRIFSNIHLYGIPYVYIPSFTIMLKWLQQGVISNGWLLADEAHRGMSARGGMSKMGRAFVDEYFQFGKSLLDVILITHMSRLIDWTARAIPTERIHCSYNEKTYKITYSKKKRGEQGTKEITFDARQYFPYYETNEKVTA